MNRVAEMSDPRRCCRISYRPSRCLFAPSLLAITCCALFSARSWAGEGPFFITYTHQMEEPGNLEFRTKNVLGRPTGGRRFLGTTAEFEYGITGWWTSELYLDGQTTGGQGAL